MSLLEVYGMLKGNAAVTQVLHSHIIMTET